MCKAVGQACSRSHDRFLVRMPFLADESCDSAVVRALRAQKHDVLAVSEARLCEHQEGWGYAGLEE